MEALTRLLLAAQLRAIHTRADEIVPALERYRPETLLVDGEMDPERLADCAALARWHCPHVRLLVLTSDVAMGGAPGASSGVDQKAEPSAEPPAEALLSAWSTPQDLLAAVNGVASSPAQVQRPVECPRGSGLLGRLTVREMQVLRTLMSGASNAQIAELLHISPNTVRTHVQNIHGKLAVRTRLEAVTMGFRCGLRPLSEAPDPKARRAQA
jgi:DNA-binding CsgD family transcriptional regulator